MALHFSRDECMGLSPQARQLIASAKKELMREFVAGPLVLARVVLGLPQDYIPSHKKRFPLFKYTLPNGRVYYEEVRSEWGSNGTPGFLCFLGLQVQKRKHYSWVKESRWTEEQMQEIIRAKAI